MTIKIGDRLPEVTFRLVTSDGPRPVTTSEFFGGKKVALFGLPGAFTPTCSAKHVPGYLANFNTLKGKGVDEIWCISVNDPFVMGAWGERDGSGQ